MLIKLYGFVIALLVLSFLSFSLWLRPQILFKNWRPMKQFRQIDFDRYTLVTTLSGVLLFLCCFVFGIWISVQKMKGLL